MKVDELEGMELDYWLAQAERIHCKPHGQGYIMNIPDGPFMTSPYIQPSNPLDWNFIGKIIERDGMGAEWEMGVVMHADFGRCYSAAASTEVGFADGYSKHSQLIAIKRCIVKRKYGETVEQESLKVAE